jgi:hypothetical protein
MTGELRECPFCGSNEHLSLQNPGSMTADMPDRPCRVVCHHIEHDTVTGPTAYGRAAAIVVWNARTIPAHPEQTPGTPRSSDDGEVERLRNALEAIRGTCNHGVNSPDEALNHIDDIARAAIAAQVTK